MAPSNASVAFRSPGADLLMAENHMGQHWRGIREGLFAGLPLSSPLTLR
jgi:hypothetical protein